MGVRKENERLNAAMSEVKLQLENYHINKVRGEEPEWRKCIDTVMAFIRENDPPLYRVVVLAYSMDGRNRRNEWKKKRAYEVCEREFITMSTYYRWLQRARLMFLIEAERVGLIDYKAKK